MHDQNDAHQKKYSSPLASSEPGLRGQTSPAPPAPNQAAAAHESRIQDAHHAAHQNRAAGGTPLTCLRSAALLHSRRSRSPSARLPSSPCSGQRNSAGRGGRLPARGTTCAAGAAWERAAPPQLADPAAALPGVVGRR